MESRKPTSEKFRSKRMAEPIVSDVPVYDSIKMIDVLPLLLCIGIVILLYFIVREIQNEQENQEVRYESLMKRMESLEKNNDISVPAGAESQKNAGIWASSEAADTVERAQKNGTYVLKNSVVSFEPEETEDDDDSLPPVVELPDEDEESEDDEDGAFS